MLDFELSLSLISARNENAGEIPHPRNFFVVVFANSSPDILPGEGTSFLLLLVLANILELSTRNTEKSGRTTMRARAPRAQTGTKLVVNRK